MYQKALARGKEYKCKSYINGKTENVIYLVTCLCGSQYVGRTYSRCRERRGLIRYS